MPEGRPLYDFAYVHMIDDRIKDLVRLAEPEEWEYKNTASDHPNPILYYYFHNTYERIAEENKIINTTDGNFACFNIGLVTTHQESLYALFSKNREVGREPWRFVKFCRKGEFELSRFSILPDLASYFDDPSCLVYDPRLELRINFEHIMQENRDRFPEPFKSMDDYALRVILNGTIENVKERVRRNYKIAVP